MRSPTRALRSTLTATAIATAMVTTMVTAPASAQQPPPITPAPAADDDALRRELDELHAKQRELERRLVKLDARRELVPLAPPPPPAAPIVLVPENATPRWRFGRGGFVLSTSDGKTNIRFRAVFNLDGRAYFGDAHPLADTFLIRRARPFIDGTLFDVVDFRLMPDFAQGQAQLLDAYVDVRPFAWLRLRGGRFMIPVGLEWLQKDTTTAFLERSLATDLVPYRDLGVMLSGDVADATFSYALAVINGGPDGANGPDFDLQTAKDYVGRIFVRPLRRARRAALTDFGLGVAGSYGFVRGTAAAPNVASYRSTGQQPIFTYLAAPAAKGTLATVAPANGDGPVLAAGDRWRFTPQLYWYLGPCGLMAEYVMSSQHVQRGTSAADILNRAWNLTLSFVMTLERATYDGVTPKHPIDFKQRNFGALELTLRYSELRIDPAAFPLFADPAVSVQAARELAAGLNWYLTDYVKIMISFHRTDFTGGGGKGDREPENALMGRLQLAL